MKSTDYIKLIDEKIINSKLICGVSFFNKIKNYFEKNNIQVLSCLIKLPDMNIKNIYGDKSISTETKNKNDK